MARSTRLSVCQRKRRYPDRDAALAVVASAAEKGEALRAYRCDRCFKFHLTSRTQGKWMGAAGKLAP